jgi:nucleoside-diphosphate-sugar epimerase
MSCVVVTGATGFVGRSLCRRLVADGHHVRGVFHQTRPDAEGAGPIEWIGVGHVGPATNWEAALDGANYVVHLAAIAHRVGKAAAAVAHLYDEVNHRGTRRLAEAVAAARGIRRLVFVSSIGAVCPLSDATVDERTPCVPVTSYGRSKLAAELSLPAVLTGASADWCILRPPLVYGPGNPGNMARLLQLMGQPVPLPFGGVRNRRSFVYVENLVDAIAVALQHPNASRRTFCVTDLDVLSTPDLVRALGRAAGRPPRVVWFPSSGLWLLGELGEMAERVARRPIGINRDTVEKLCGSLPVDGGRFRRDCGWTPPFTMSEGLRATMAGGATSEN